MREGFLAAVLNTIDALVVVLDTKGRIVEFNRGCERATGFASAEVVGEVVWDHLIIPEELVAVREVFRDLRAGQFPNQHENYWQTLAGGRRRIAWRNTALLDDRGEVEYIIGTGLDITDAQAAEDRARHVEEILVRTERLRELGQMAAGVSHDLGNILNPLALHLEVVRRALDRDEVDDAKESISVMQRVVVRGVETLERLRSYSRQTVESKPQAADLDLLAREAVAIVKPRTGATKANRAVTINEALQSPPHIIADTGEVISALVNIIMNAIDAFGGKGGTITVSSGEADGGAWLTIEDDGPGMPQEVEEHVFDRFFTTKGERGTGLGLANARGAVERHGGTITLSTVLGKGTTFRVWFPVHR